MEFVGGIYINRHNVVEVVGQLMVGGGGGGHTEQQNFNYVEDGVTGEMEDPEFPQGGISDMSQRQWVERIRSAG